MTNFNEKTSNALFSYLGKTESMCNQENESCMESRELVRQYAQTIRNGAYKDQAHIVNCAKFAVGALKCRSVRGKCPAPNVIKRLSLDELIDY